MERNNARSTLAAIRQKRPRYSDDQINFIRESYLLDNHSAPWINLELGTPSSNNAIWRIATGLSYPHVPLSPRLQAAAAAKGQKANGAETEPAAADPVRAEELLEESSPDWG